MRSCLLSVARTFFLTDLPCAGVVRSFCRNKTDLAKQLGELKDDLLKLRVQKIAGGSAAKLTKMFVPLTFQSEVELGNADRLVNVNFAFSVLQKCSPQINRQGVDRDEPKVSTTPSRVL